jgi:hypothetical protein
LVASPAADPPGASSAVAPAALSSVALEPSLVETQEAAARAAGGSAEDAASRASRARLAHWAPQLRGQSQLRDDEKSRNGEFRLAPLHERDVGTGHVWSVMLAWDFSQVVYAREESQIALANANLARMRREAAEKASRLFIERRRTRARWLSEASAPARLELCFAELRLTAELDALTAGLFRDALSREEAACAMEEKR